MLFYDFSHYTSFDCWIILQLVLCRARHTDKKWIEKDYRIPSKGICLFSFLCLGCHTGEGFFETVAVSTNGHSHAKSVKPKSTILFDLIWGYYVLCIRQAFCFNITWSLRRGKILPKLEFFPWVLSFILEFCFFTEVFCQNFSKIYKIEDFCIQNSWNWKYLLIKIAKPVPTPLKRIKIEFFS